MIGGLAPNREGDQGVTDFPKGLMTERSDQYTLVDTINGWKYSRIFHEATSARLIHSRALHSPNVRISKKINK